MGLKEPPPMRRSGLGSRRWRSESCVGPMRSCARRVRISPRRSMSARPVDLSVHRDQDLTWLIVGWLGCWGLVVVGIVGGCVGWGAH